MTRPAINKAINKLMVAVACLLMTACAGQTGPPRNGQVTTAAVSPHATRALAVRNREKAISAYQDYLARYPDGAEHDRIRRRLADLLVEQAADQQLATAGDSRAPLAAARQSRVAAIGHYEYLLNKYPHSPDNTDLLYQLSRVYEETGQSQQALAAIDRLLSQQPDSNLRLYADTRFRRGELMFGEGAYLEAGDSYQAVVDLGATVPAYEQALYKLGWSLFKQERYPEALPVLFAFLDLNLPPGKPLDAQLAGLSLADQEQVADVFRVISMTFAQSGGVDAVTAFFGAHGKRSYEEHVYLGLADLYVEQEQVSVAAHTWRALAERDPFGAQAPRLIAKAIELYRQAGFQQRVVETETLFVRDYGSGSAFWRMHTAADFADVQAQLQTSLQDLARVSHTQAVNTQDPHAVRQAEQWYRQYLAAYSDTADAAEMHFQLAELLYERGRYRQAIDDYEQAAWSYGAHAHAADAALGALRASEKARANAAPVDREMLATRTAVTAQRFVLSYPQHAAAPGLLAQTGTTLLEKQQYDAALQISQQVLAVTPAAPPPLRQTVWSLQAQAQYGLGHYAAATAAYREALQLADRDDKRRTALQAGLATATYKLAEQTATQGDRRGAVVLYQQAAQLAPDATIRSKAQYDAATALLAEESWAQAIRMLEQFRSDYPDDPLQGEVTRKLAYASDQAGMHDKAAAEYLRLGKDRQQPDSLQRESLLRAAELYTETGMRKQAITTRELYLQRFPRPAGVAVELMQQLSDLAAGNAARRARWLEKIVQLDRTAGTAATRVPAAEAALELAAVQLAAFRRIQLTNPVQKSLARKLKAMKHALQELEGAIDYGVIPVTTAATYHIASMYDELGSALLTSARPARLNVEELAEYDALLAEQAAPFEQRAIKLHAANAQRSATVRQDPWIEKSVQRLAELQSGKP